MITIEVVDEAWSNLNRFKETAEQHDFPKLLSIDTLLEPLYEDLHKNWDEHHAEIFMMWMFEFSKQLGFKCPEF